MAIRYIDVRVGESITIGEGISLKVLPFDDRGLNRAKIGIVAPRHVKITKVETKVQSTKDR